MPEGNAFLDSTGGSDGDAVETLAEGGSLLAAGSFRERRGHRTIVTAAHKGSAICDGPVGKKVHSLLAGGGGAHDAQKYSD
jgi:hypothetical protein